MSLAANITLEVGGTLDPMEVHEVLQHAPWASGRSPDEIARMLARSFVAVGARKNGKLIGFGRALSDGVFRAVIEDVVVVPEARRLGIGRAMINRLVEELGGVEEVALCCVVETVGFYRRLGFEVFPGAQMKKRTGRE